MTGRVLGVLAAAAGVLTVAAGTAAGWFGAGVVTLAFATAVAVGFAANAYRSPTPPPARPRPRRPPADAAAAAFERTVGALAMARQGPRWADTALRPRLARVTDTLLLARTGRGLGEDPTRARALLGPELFDFLDPARTPRGHDDGRGLTTDELTRMISRLEDLR
jgi:hypothetical protein